MRYAFCAGAYFRTHTSDVLRCGTLSAPFSSSSGLMDRNQCTPTHFVRLATVPCFLWNSWHFSLRRTLWHAILCSPFLLKRSHTTSGPKLNFTMGQAHSNKTISFLHTTDGNDNPETNQRRLRSAGSDTNCTVSTRLQPF